MPLTFHANLAEEIRDGVSPARTHINHATQISTVTHSAAGALVLPVTADTRLIVVTASANVTDITPTGMNVLGTFGTVWVEITATATITLASTTVTPIDMPATLATGAATVFQLVRIDS